MEKDHKIIALIPAYNEAGRIAPVIAGANNHLPVMVVDDGSVDNTVQLAESCGAQVVRQFPNQGKGAALRAGFRQAISEGYEAVITLDADGQHDPQEIPAFLRQLAESNADLIIGARNFHQMPFVRRLANTTGKLIISWALGQPVRDNQSGYRLIRRRLMESLLSSDESGFEFEVEMIARCLKNQWKLDWVPIRTIYADQGSHIRPGKHLLNFFRVAKKTRQIMREP